MTAIRYERVQYRAVPRHQFHQLLSHWISNFSNIYFVEFLTLVGVLFMNIQVICTVPSVYWFRSSFDIGTVPKNRI